MCGEKRGTALPLLLPASAVRRRPSFTAGRVSEKMHEIYEHTRAPLLPYPLPHPPPLCVVAATHPSAPQIQQRVGTREGEIESQERDEAAAG